MVLSVALFTVLGCSSAPKQKVETVTHDPRPKTEILFTSARHLELEPCGCSLSRQGGLVREWNLIRRLKAESPSNEFFIFTAGTTFVPIEENFSLKQKDIYRTKAAFLIEALDLMQTKAFSPSANDFALGLNSLRELEEKSSFPWVSANLYQKGTGKLAFKPYVELFARGGSLIVTGVSAKPSNLYGGAKEVTVKDAVASLKGVLKGLPASPTARMVVVLSSLDAAGREKLQQELPEVNLVFGGAEADSSYKAEQYTGRFIHINPANRGRSLARFTLQGNSFAGAFYNPEIAEGYAGSRSWWSQSNVETDDAIKAGTIKGAEKKQALATKARFEGYLRRTSTIPLAESPDVVKYDSSFTVLNESFDNPKNEFTALVDRYREAVRGLALQSEN